MTTPVSPARPVLICGVGALGSHVAQALRNHPGGLRLLDMDRVEARNALNQFYPKTAAGKFKTQALRQLLLVNHGVTVEVFTVELRDSNAPQIIQGDLALVLDCFDNHAARSLAARRGAEVGVPVLHAGISADASAGLVTWTLPEDREVQGVQTCTDPAVLPCHVLVAALAARAALEFLRHGTRTEYRVAAQQVYTSR